MVFLFTLIEILVAVLIQLLIIEPQIKLTYIFNLI